MEACRRARRLTDDGAERRFLDRLLTELAAHIVPDSSSTQNSLPDGSANTSHGT